MIFIVPGTDEKYAQGAFKAIVHHSFAFGVAALASILERDGFFVKIHNDRIHTLDKESIKNLGSLEKGVPVFALTSLTIQAHRAKQLSKMIKEVLPSAKVIVGGIHATTMPQEFLDSGLDYAIVGEGDLIISEIASRLSKGLDVFDIPGVAFLDPHGEMNINPPLKERIPLDQVPQFPFHLFEDDIEHYDVGILTTSRGCPYDCIFCSQQAITGHSYRSRPLDIVLDELDIAINKYSARNIFFIEDNFVVNKNRTVELCDRIIAKNYHKKNVKFMCQFRGDAATPEILEKLVAAGFETVFFGIETGSERVAKMIKKGETVETNRKAVHLAKKYGLNVSATFIIGFPQETAADRDETFRMAMKLPLDALRVNIAIPYPGTPLYEMVKDQLVIEEGWTNFNVVSSLITGPFAALKLPYIAEGTKEDELRYLSMWANMKFWLRPSQFFKFFKLSSTGVTRFPKRWYFDIGFWKELVKISIVVASILGWIVILGAKFHYRKWFNLRGN